MIRRGAAALLAALCLAACGRDGQAGGISREKFVAANVAIRLLGDTASPRKRAEVLRKHGVTDRQLRAWVRANARDPEAVAKAWEQIAFKLDSTLSPTLPGAGPVPPGATPPPGVVGPPPGVLPEGTTATPPPPPPVRDMRGRRRPGTPPADQPAPRPEIRLQ